MFSKPPNGLVQNSANSGALPTLFDHRRPQSGYASIAILFAPTGIFAQISTCEDNNQVVGVGI
jgi:hypothetical protein